MIHDEEKRLRKQIWVTILGIIVVIAIVLVVLGLTVFKSRDPKVHINTIDLETFSIGQTSLNMSLLLDITVSNPNRASFTYSNGLTRLFYYGDPVGQALIPAGKIKSKADEYLSVLLFVEASRVIMNANLPGNIVSGRLPVVATTTLTGTLKVLGVFKHHALSTSDCDIFIFVANATVQSFYCRHAVRL
ncbi:uncharacterized protein [Physcomitrium patens]|uniref:Late embryogenesis abundant protein LEA-2 subgroup domain-containing protein n=1 Tax=Physcomitrium patens TaxID=3218 RepID=A9RUJ7_PHYPA|nr:uncharacterized protein LOC112286381 [Physcomitrium patens]PNR48130.1 hypothetical protein PHYPA_012603 [Physcomitrium patens]|eukprot:XP_024384004.1 uncharacterized protein LOC112286381 [Physcomitrella patens]